MFPESNNPGLGGLRRILPEEVRNQEIEIASHEVVKCSLVVKFVKKKTKTKREREQTNYLPTPAQQRG